MSRICSGSAAKAKLILVTSPSHAYYILWRSVVSDWSIRTPRAKRDYCPVGYGPGNFGPARNARGAT